jgi:hypothetical protein
MRPKLRDNEGLYFLRLRRNGEPENAWRALEYIRSSSRWFAVRRGYEYHIEYIFIMDQEVESYLSLAYQITRESTFEIQD